MMQNLDLMSNRANNDRYNWVAVCVLSHGRRKANRDEVLGCDGEGVDRSEIINMFADASKCPKMHMKPKLFIFQACRGEESHPEPRQPVPSAPPPPTEETQTDSGAVPIVASTGRPMKSDYVIASSTIPEHVAFRSTTMGSFYIRHLCKELQERGHIDHVADILTMVNNKVLGFNRQYPSAPEYITTLSKKFQLQRTRDSTERWGL